MNAEEYRKQRRNQSIVSNDAWHKRNIEQHLRLLVEYARDANLIGVQKAAHDYAEAEHARLQAKLAIMEQYDMERWPTLSPHRDLAISLWEQAQGYIAENQRRERERRS